MAEFLLYYMAVPAFIGFCAGHALALIMFWLG